MKSEEAVFEHHPGATHFRYPHLYGPYQIAPREWCIVRRILDGRRAIIVPEDGLSINHCGYVENAAHAVLLAIDKPEASAGQIYNCGDERVLTLRQVIEVIARALAANWKSSRCRGSSRFPRAHDLAAWTTHRVLDLTKLKTQLGYRDVVAPEAWIGDHRAYG